MARQYFKTKDNLTRRVKSRTRKEQLAANERKRLFLSSPEGREAIERIQLADKLSTVFQIKGMIK